MKSPQRRRLNTQTSANGLLNNNTTDNIITDLDETAAVNVHGLRSCGSIEPENADANSNGFWCVFCLPAEVIDIDDLPETFGELDQETFLPYLWGVGCWTASNQAPYHFEFTPSTTRTCQKGARIVFYVIKTGISAGNVRINMTQTMFTSS